MSETQLSNLESENLPDIAVDNTLEGFQSQGIQEDNTQEVKKKKKRNPTQPAPFPRVITRL